MGEDVTRAMPGIVRIPGRMPGACVLHTFVPAFPCHVQPLQDGQSHQTSEFPTTSDFPAELPTHRHGVEAGEECLFCLEKGIQTPMARGRST